jgi:apolipoprotein N-acyltransferase
MQRYLIFGVLAFIAAIAYGTIGQAGLPYAIYFKLAPWLGHPSMRTFATIEHLCIFAIFGVLLAFAFPDPLLTVCCAILFVAHFFEYLQSLTADRHGTMRDACEKMAGGLLGAVAAYATIRWCRRVTNTKEGL